MTTFYQISSVGFSLAFRGPDISKSNTFSTYVSFLAQEFVWPAVVIISVFLLLLDIQTLLLMCNLDSSLTDLMNETLGLGL